MSNYSLNLVSIVCFCSSLNSPTKGSLEGLAAEISSRSYFSISGFSFSDRFSFIFDIQRRICVAYSHYLSISKKPSLVYSLSSLAIEPTFWSPYSSSPMSFAVKVTSSISLMNVSRLSVNFSKTEKVALVSLMPMSPPSLA